MSGSKPKTNKITSQSEKGDHPKIDDSVFFKEEDIQQYQLLIVQLQWAILLGIFNIAIATMTMAAFRSAPRKGYLNQVKQICGYLSKMRHSAIQICTEEPDYSDIARTEYHWKLSVYRDAKEELPEDADGWKRFHSLTKKAKTMLRMVN